MSLEPDALHALKVGLLEGVRVQIAALGLLAPARVCVYPGLEVAWDNCECGLLAVHHLQVYPSEQFPEPALRNTCKVWVVEIVVTVARCASTGEGDQPPACEDLEAEAELQAADLVAAQRGIQCVLDARRPPLYRWATHTPIGPGGMCVGFEQHMLVGFPNCRVEC